MDSDDNAAGRDDTQPCACGSGCSYARCCKPLLCGLLPAASAEQLMRSRYTAYVRGDEAYLLGSWHPDTRPPSLQLSAEPAPHWLGLQVLATEHGQAGDVEGVVEFRARYRVGGRAGVLHESSRFLCEQGRWYYLDGEMQGPAPGRGGKQGRNAPCPCGSGRKFKRCCGP